MASGGAHHRWRAAEAAGTSVSFAPLQESVQYCRSRSSVTRLTWLQLKPVSLVPNFIWRDTKGRSDFDAGFDARGGQLRRLGWLYSAAPGRTFEARSRRDE